MQEGHFSGKFGWGPLRPNDEQTVSYLFATQIPDSTDRGTFDRQVESAILRSIANPSRIIGPSESGTLFRYIYVRIPMGEWTDTKGWGKPRYDGRGTMKCLVVEDDVTSNKILNSFLSYFGECAAAFDGAEAIEAYRMALQQNEPFDLICMDIMMPRLDGHKALEEIRKLEMQHGLSEEQRAKVIMTTCLDGEDDKRQAYHSGCNAFMIKPIFRQSLMKEIEKLGLIV